MTRPRSTELFGWLGELCRLRRTEAGATREELGAELGINVVVISHFENGRSVSTGLVERLVAAYAELGDEDASDIWRQAIDQWGSHR